MRKFFVRKDKLFALVKTMCGFAFQTGSDFELQYVFRFGDRFDFIGEFFADAQAARFFGYIHFLDFANLSGVVQQVLDVAAQKPYAFVASKSQQVNNIRIVHIFKIERLLYRSVKGVDFEQIHETVDGFEIVDGGHSDGNWIQSKVG